MMNRAGTKREEGFTLLEMQLVLGTIILMYAVIHVVSFRLYETYEQEVFLTQLKKDLYYAQTFAFDHQKKVYVMMKENTSDYFAVSYGHGSILQSQEFQTIKFPIGRRVYITYNQNGNIVTPQTIYLAGANNRLLYKVVFQLGRGRFYISAI